MPSSAATRVYAPPFPPRRSSDLELTAGRDQQHVDGAQLSELLLGQEVAQVPEVADVHPVDLDRKDDVLPALRAALAVVEGPDPDEDRKSTRLNSSHRCSSYAVFCRDTRLRTAVPSPTLFRS